MGNKSQAGGCWVQGHLSSPLQWEGKIALRGRTQPGLLQPSRRKKNNDIFSWPGSACHPVEVSFWDQLFSTLRSSGVSGRSGVHALTYSSLASFEMQCGFLMSFLTSQEKALLCFP